MIKALEIMSRIILVPVVCGVTGLALMPEGVQMLSMMSSHIINHILAFAVIAALFKLSLPSRHWGMAVLATNGVGVLIEAMQGVLTQDRTPSVFDLAMNLVGSGLGVGCAVGFLCSVSVIRAQRAG